MGANFQFEKIDKTDEADVVLAFAKLQGQDRYENGHSYSGGFGMADGLDFAEGAFHSEDDASEWLGENAQKWGPAIAVRALDDADKHIGWFIGANCAS